MNLPARYGTATAFRIALEAKLKSLARSEGADLQRLRRQVSFDRLLARLFHGPEVPWLLKSGYAMELRLRLARATKDIDLSLPGGRPGPAKILEDLQLCAVQIDLSGLGIWRRIYHAMMARVIFMFFLLLAGPGCAVTPRPVADALKNRLIERENRFLERLASPSAMFVEDPDLRLPVDDLLPSPAR